MRIWREAEAGGRAEALRSALDPDARGNVNAVAWYLVACGRLREQRTPEAARAFGIAHHADCNLESAALLTFACLKAASRGPGAIVEQIAVTWDELGRPAIGDHREDRLVLECLASTTRDIPQLSPIGRLAWLVVAPPEQCAIEQALRNGKLAWVEVMRPEPCA
ncbi:MAG: hypothetical protein ACE5F9_07505 [Phycisphaerae bacterium]